MESENFLYDYQLAAVNRASNGCIFNGGVGSGKSRAGLYYYYKINGGSLLTYQDHIPMHIPFGDGTPQDLYIITTAMKRDTCEWDAELANFYMSTDPKVSMYKNTIVIDSWNSIKKYGDIKGAFFIFDEDRVTGSGVWVDAFLKIAKNNSWIILSATPGDTWDDYIPVFLANGFYKNKTEFDREHVVFARYTKWRQVDRYIGLERLVRLREKILINMDFERKTVPHHVDIYTKYDVMKYKTVIKTRWNPFTDEPIKQPSALCYILRRIVNEDESRVCAVLDILDKQDTAIIFYNFNYELDMLRYVFSNCDDGSGESRFEVAEWNGQMHQEIPTGKKWVYLVQYTAGCEGWNCIRTNTIIFFSQNYSYKVLTQAAGRIDRLNSPFIDLYYYHLKSRSSIDLAIANAVLNKKKFNEGHWAGKKLAVKEVDRFSA